MASLLSVSTVTFSVLPSSQALEVHQDSPGRGVYQAHLVHQALRVLQRRPAPTFPNQTTVRPWTARSLPTVSVRQMLRQLRRCFLNLSEIRESWNSMSLLTGLGTAWASMDVWWIVKKKNIWMQQNQTYHLLIPYILLTSVKNWEINNPLYCRSSGCWKLEKKRKKNLEFIRLWITFERNALFLVTNTWMNQYSKCLNLD